MITPIMDSLVVSPGCVWCRRRPLPRRDRGVRAGPVGVTSGGLVRHPLLGQDRAAGVVQGRQEMRLRILIGARAPRMVLPSTAITVLPSMVPVRVQNQHIKWASTSAGSWSCSTRRIVDSDGRTWPISTPRVSRSAVVCSHIAVRLRQPASTSITARDRTANRLGHHCAAGCFWTVLVLYSRPP